MRFSDISRAWLAESPRQYRNLPSCTPDTPCPPESKLLDFNLDASFSGESVAPWPVPVSRLRHREVVFAYRRSVGQPSTALDFGVSDPSGRHVAGAPGRSDFRTSYTTIFLRRVQLPDSLSTKAVAVSGVAESQAVGRAGLRNRSCRTEPLHFSHQVPLKLVSE